jgi:Flp pilus assembly pilin Flp
MVEYGLIVASIAVVVVVAATALGGRISGLFGSLIP